MDFRREIFVPVLNVPASVGRCEGLEGLDTWDLESSKAVFTPMPGGWRWLSSGTKLGLWTDHLLVASQCGLGFLATWRPQGTQMLTWCLGVPKATLKRQPGGNYLAFYDQALELTWHSFHCGQNHSQMGGVSVTLYEEHMGGVCYCSLCPSSLPDFIFCNSVSLTLSHGPWCLTLLSGSLLSFVPPQRLPHNHRGWVEITL